MKIHQKLFFSAAISAATLHAVSATASIQKDFAHCASEAIATKNMSAKKINVDLPQKPFVVMDHDASPDVRRYVLDIKNPRNGDHLGKFSCQLTQDGKITAIHFLSQR